MARGRSAENALWRRLRTFERGPRCRTSAARQRLARMPATIRVRQLRTAARVSYQAGAMEPALSGISVRIVRDHPADGWGKEFETITRGLAWHPACRSGNGSGILFSRARSLPPSTSGPGLHEGSRGIALPLRRVGPASGSDWKVCRSDPVCRAFRSAGSTIAVVADNHVIARAEERVRLILGLPSADGPSVSKASVPSEHFRAKSTPICPG